MPPAPGRRYGGIDGAPGPIGPAGPAIPGGTMPGGIIPGGIMPGGIMLIGPACGFWLSKGGVFGASWSTLPMRITSRMLPRLQASAIGSAPGSSRVDTTSSAPTAAKSWFCGSGRYTTLIT